MSATDSERARIAHHEAGHAVVAIVSGFKVQHASIIGDGEILGQVRHDWSAELLGQLRAEDLDLEGAIRAVEVLRAGRAAEDRYLGNGRRVAWGADGSQSDEEKALELAHRAVGHVDEAIALRELAGELAKSAVHLYWNAIRSLADLLLERDEIPGNLVEDLVESTDLIEPNVLE